MHGIHGCKNVVQSRAHFLYHGLTVLHFFVAVVHRAYGLVCQGEDFLDHGGDFAGGIGSAFSEFAHFIRDHGKTASLLTGPCCFNCSIQSQKIGLVCDLVDDLYDVTDFLRLAAQGTHHPGGFVDDRCRTRDAFDRFVHHAAAIARCFMSICRNGAGMFHDVGRFVEAIGNLIERSGDSLGLLLLHVRPTRNIFADHVDIPGRLADRVAGIA